MENLLKKELVHRYVHTIIRMYTVHCTLASQGSEYKRKACMNLHRLLCLASGIVLEIHRYVHTIIRMYTVHCTLASQGSEYKRKACMNLHRLLCLASGIVLEIHTRILEFVSPLSYPDNSPGGQFPTVKFLVLMSGFIPW